MTRSRAALLPHPADPLMFWYWIQLFDRVWANEIDKLYVYISSPIEKPVRDWMIDICNRHPKISLQWNNEIVDHGIALDRMLDIVTEDYIFIIEDDGFIFKPGFVDKYFQTIESGQADIVGSARGSCADEIMQAAKVKWDLSYDGEGDVGPNFWPCFFWIKKELLLKTDRNFRAKHWVMGETIPGLNLPVAMAAGLIGDTFVNTSLQLRGMVAKDRIHLVPQYHGSPNDLVDYDRGRNLWNDYAMWTHAGSLSSGTNGILRDDFGRPLARRSIDPPNDNDILPNYCNSEGEQHEWERRVQWWKMFLDNAPNADLPAELLQVGGFVQEYAKAIDRLVRQYDLSWERINKRIKIYKQLGL